MKKLLSYALAAALFLPVSIKTARADHLMVEPEYNSIPAPINTCSGHAQIKYEERLVVKEETIDKTGMSFYRLELQAPNTLDLFGFTNGSPNEVIYFAGSKENIDRIDRQVVPGTYVSVDANITNNIMRGAPVADASCSIVKKINPPASAKSAASPSCSSKGRCHSQ